MTLEQLITIIKAERDADIRNWSVESVTQRDFVLSSDFASMGTVAIAEQVITDRYGDIYIYQCNIAERSANA